MKVICILPITQPERGKENAPRPQVGDVDLVIGQKQIYGEWYYALNRFGYSNGYLSTHFATLPDQPEEVVEEQELEEATA